MVYTKRTRHIGRRGGRAGSRAVAAGLGPRGGVGERNRTSSSRTRSSRSSSRGDESVPLVESSQTTPIDDSSYDPSEESYEEYNPRTFVDDSSYDASEEPYEEYTPRTPTREDLNDTIAILDRENTDLRKELSKVQEEKDKTEQLLDNLQMKHDTLEGKHVTLEGELSMALKENDDVWERNYKMGWMCKELEWERRIAARSWRVRLGDRARYYRGAASEYAGLIRGYLSSWMHLYHQGPNLEFLWKYRPDKSYDEAVGDYHYPADFTIE